MVEPILNNVLKEYKNIKFFNIDIDSAEGQVMITKHAVRSVPTLILFGENNKEIKRIVGLVTEYEIRELLNLPG
jgi:thiol-disulfide isomerase/thioredoxin